MDAVKKRWLLVDLLLIAIYCLIFFLGFGFIHTSAVWVNFFFILVSHAAMWLCLSVLPVASNRFALSATVAVLCLALIASVTFVGTILMIFEPSNTKLSFLVHLVLLLIFAIIQIMNAQATKHTESQVSDPSNDFVNEALNMLLIIQSSHRNDKIDFGTVQIRDILRSSQHRFNPHAAHIEKDIMQLMQQTKDSSLEGSIVLNNIEMIKRLLETRNSLTKVK